MSDGPTFKNGHATFAPVADGQSVIIRTKPDSAGQRAPLHIPATLTRPNLVIQHKFQNTRIITDHIGVLPPESRTLRVGIWLTNTTHYSGGRIHLFQYGHCLAASGLAEVFMFSNMLPPWRVDYPVLPNFRLLLLDKQKQPPDDLDICFSDRNEKLRRALAYRDKHPRCSVFALNFETANWAASVWPPLGEIISRENIAEDYLKCDGLFANSQESAKWLAAFLEENYKESGWCGSEILPLPPAVNTYALSRSGENRSLVPRGRKYAVWVSRGVPHKCLDLCVDAVWGAQDQCDLVVIGDKVTPAHNSDKHNLIFLKAITDAQKYALMRYSHTVLAPSLFEGYGMVPGEALASGVTPVVFDLPVLRQTYGSRLDYVKHGDFEGYKRRVLEVVHAPKDEADSAEAIDLYGIEAMKKRVYALPYHNIGKVSVSVQFIVYWGFCPEAIEAIYDTVDQIVIAYGPIDLVRARNVQPDGSLEAIRALPDPDHKIEVYVRDAWKDKTEMHNFCCRKIRGNRMIIAGGDMIWEGLESWVRDESIFSACPRMVHFIQDGRHYITEAPDGRGGNWGKPVKPFGTFATHCLYTYWRPSFGFRCQSQPTDSAGFSLNRLDMKEKRQEACNRHPETTIYHVGNLLPQNILKAKADFYLDRDKCPDKRRMDGDILDVTWVLPETVKKALTRLGAL